MPRESPFGTGGKSTFTTPQFFPPYVKQMSKRISAIKLRSQHQNTPNFVQPGVKNHAGLDFHSVTSPNPLKQLKNLIFLKIPVVLKEFCVFELFQRHKKVFLLNRFSPRRGIFEEQPALPEQGFGVWRYILSRGRGGIWLELCCSRPGSGIAAVAGTATSRQVFCGPVV